MSNRFGRKVLKTCLRVALLTLAAAAPACSAYDSSDEPHFGHKSLAAEVTVVGALPGKGAVDEKGQARFSLPLDLPLGPNGFAPRAELTYRSSSSDGLMGPGFAISGPVSAISRCPKTWLDDPAREPVEFTAQDALCLDGNRMFLQSGAPFTSGALYRTRIENFQRIQLQNDISTGDGQLVVTGKDGTRHYYGGDLRNTKKFSGINYTWFRAKSVDTFGNEILYSYDYEMDDKKASTLDMRPSNITYAIGAYPNAHRIQFTYEPRPKAAKGWFFGAPWERTRRLRSITTSTGAQDVARRYFFYYGDSLATGRSLLREVQSCGLNDTGTLECLPSTKLDWHEPSAAFQQLDGPSEAVAELGLPNVIGDFNHDGTDELIAIDTDEGVLRRWVLNDNAMTTVSDVNLNVLSGYDHLLPIAVDLDNDPEPEILALGANCGDCVEKVEWPWLVNGQPQTPVTGEINYATGMLWFDNTAGYNMSFDWQAVSWQGDAPSRIYMASPAGDADGDGRADRFVCGGPSYATATWRYLRRSGTAAVTFEAYDLKISCLDYDRFEPPVDIDGDGAAEFLIGRSPRDFHAVGDLLSAVHIPGDALRNGTLQAQINASSSYPWLTSTNLPVDVIERLVSANCLQPGFATGDYYDFTRGLGLNRWADFNDDGLVDLLRFDAYTEGAGLPSPGIGEDPDAAVDSGYCDVTPSGPPSGFPALRVWYNTGTEFVVPPNVNPIALFQGNYSLDFFHAATRRVTNSFVADLTADGTPDVVVPSSNCLSYKLHVPGTDFSTDIDPTPFDWTCEPALSPSQRHGARRFASPVRLGLNQRGMVFVNQTSGQYRTYTRHGGATDLLRRATDGLGRRTEFDYSPAADGTVHQHAKLCDEQHRCDMRDVQLVSRMRNDAGMSNQAVWHETSFNYRGGRFGRAGRGFLGFHEISEVTQVSGDVVPLGMRRRSFDLSYDKTFRDYPRARTALIDVVDSVYAAADQPGGYMREVTRQFRSAEPKQSPDAPGFFIVSEVNTHEALKFPGSACASITTPCTVPEINAAKTNHPPHDFVTRSTPTDKFGTVLSETRTTKNGWKDEIQYGDFIYDISKWIFGLPQTITAISTTPSNEVDKRTTALFYNLTTRKITIELREPSNAELWLRTSYGYDSYGNIDAITRVNKDGESRSGYYEYDAQDGVTLGKSINDLGHTTQIVQNPRTGAIQVEQEPNGSLIQDHHDPFGRLVGSQRRSALFGPSDGNDLTVARAADSAAPNSIYRIDTHRATGQQSRTYFDRLNREVRTCWLAMGEWVAGMQLTSIPGQWLCRDTLYTQRGDLEKQSMPYLAGANPAAWTAFAHDSLGRLKWTQSAGGRIQTFQYEPHETVAMDAADHATRTLTDDLGRPWRTIDAIGTSVCYRYGPFGLLKNVQKNCVGPGGAPPAGPKVDALTFTHDAYGNPLTAFDPDTGDVSYNYTDGFRDLKNVTNALKQTTTYEYDTLGRIKKIIRPEGNSTFTWDTGKLGMLHQVSGLDFTHEQFAYDAFLRPSSYTSIVSGTPYTLSYTYSGPHVSTITYPGNFAVQYDHDAVGYLRQVRRIGESTPRWRAEKSSLLGSIERAKFGNDVHTTRTRDWDGFLTSSISAHPPTAVTVERMAYKWNTLGELDRRTDHLTGQHQEFGYDALSRLTSTKTYASGSLAETAGNDYDIYGNLTKKHGIGGYSYLYGASGNRPWTIAGEPYQWDENGQLLSRGFVNGSTFESYTWTSSGKLRDYTAGATQKRHIYNGSSERVRTLDLATGGNTTFLSGIYERTVEGPSTVHRYSVLADGVVAQFTRSVESGVTTENWEYVHPDHLGSPRLTTDQNGKPVRQVMYDPWGHPKSAKNWTKDAAPLGNKAGFTRDFTGHDQRLGKSLVNMNARHYDTKLGRFISADSIIPYPLDSQSFNRFSYVRNNPLKRTDPTGHVDIDYEQDYDDYGDYYDGYDDFDQGDYSAGGEDYNVDGLYPYMPDPQTAAGLNGGLAGAYGDERTIADGLQEAFEYFADAVNALQAEAERESRFGPAKSTHSWTYTADDLLDDGVNFYITGLLDPFEQAARPAGVWGDLFSGNFGQAAQSYGALATDEVISFGITVVGGKIVGGLLGKLGSRPGVEFAEGAAQGAGFKNFKAFKRAVGPAGDDLAWHHIVEKHSANAARFAPEAIHNTGNLIRVEKATHDRISGFYRSKQPEITGSRTLTVREWISRQSFENQQAFGLDVLRMFGISF